MTDIQSASLVVSKDASSEEIIKFWKDCEEQKKGVNGLSNIANSCYINTSIQCLGFCPSFLEFILFDESINKLERGHLIKELQEIYQALWIKDVGLIPSRFIKYVAQHLDFIRLGDQNDIHEFLTIFIDKLNEPIKQDLSNHKSAKIPRFDNPMLSKLYKKCDDAWKQNACREYSRLIELFYGQNVVQIVCGSCGKIHHNYEIFSQMCVPISKDTTTLQQCIDLYMKEEHLNDKLDDVHNIEWKCDVCGKKEKSLKTVKIWRFPKILIVCLKRFTHDGRKNNQMINVPETLDMGTHSIYSMDGCYPKYKLLSVACHIGSSHGGHYYALCKHPCNGHWYKVDDMKVSKYSEDFTNTNNFYMGFYALLDDGNGAPGTSSTSPS